MRFLILGATGMAGHMVAAYLLERGHEVSGSYRQETSALAILCDMGMDSVYLDATDPARLPMAVRPDDYDVIVNCIGLLNTACDNHPEEAVRLNALLPHRLEAITAGTECRVIHLSTDCVFAGNTGPYQESAEPDGNTLYDLTKAAGELYNGKDLTLRQSIVGPDPDENGIGLLNWFMAQDGVVFGYARAMWTGLTTLELAKAVEVCAEAGLCGLVNLVPDTNISKFELLKLFNSCLRGDFLSIESNGEMVLDKTLIRRAESLPFTPGSYESQISELAGWVARHKAFYPHYLKRCGD